MKTYILILSILIGFSGFVTAQSVSPGKIEKIRSQKWLHKKTHFKKPKADKKMRYNGTIASKSIRLSQCHPDGMTISHKNSYKMSKKKWKRSKNKTFGTYTYTCY